MISLPPGFDAVLLLDELFTFALPLVALSFTISSAFLIIYIINRVTR